MIKKSTPALGGGVQATMGVGAPPDRVPDSALDLLETTPSTDGFPQLAPRGGGGWLALIACGGAFWPMTSRHPYYCGHPHCRGHPPFWVGIQDVLSAHGVLP